MAAKALCDAWVDFLTPYPWDWFATLTFRDMVHPERADKLFRLWCSEINRSIWGPRWYKKRQGIFWVRALELQRRGVIHFHALMSGRGFDLNDHARRLTYMDRWYELAGIARIEVPRTEAVVNYVSKYVAKGGDIDCSESLVYCHKEVEVLRRLHKELATVQLQVPVTVGPVLAQALSAVKIHA